MIYEKYIYFSDVLRKNKNILFNNDETYLYTQKIIRMYMNELHLLNKYNVSRAEIMREFSLKKNEIHKRECESVLQYIFCFDIKNLILEFL